MAALTTDRRITRVTGDYSSHGVKASTTIYAGAFVGDDGSGWARGLAAADPFLGISYERVDNSAGANGAKSVRVERSGRILHAVSGATDQSSVGTAVYASDDQTLTTTSTSNTLIGTIDSWDTAAGLPVVQYDCVATD